MKDKRKYEIKARVWLKHRPYEPSEAIAVNPGGWFGKCQLIGVSIANALNPLVVIEADHLQDAIDELADSERWGHLINIDIEDRDEEDQDTAGNDSHPVCLDNVHAYPDSEVEKIEYFINIHPEDDSLLTEVQTAIENYDKDYLG